MRQQLHCVKSVRIQENTDQKKLRISTLFTQCLNTSKTALTCHNSPYSVGIQENTDQKKLRIWTIFSQCWNTSKRALTCQKNEQNKLAISLSYFTPLTLFHNIMLVTLNFIEATMSLPQKIKENSFLLQKG